jgi:excisionase family DNA binding protein
MEKIDAGPLPVECKSFTPSLVSAGDAAKMLGIGERNLWSLQNRGEIPTVKIGRRRLFDPRDLSAFIDRCKTPGTLAV